MRLILLLLLILSPSTKPATQPAGGPITPPARRDVPGQRITIDAGEIFVPDFCKPSGDKIDVVLWFLGAAWVVEQEFYDARKNAILFVASRKTVDAGFPTEESFDALLAQISKAIDKPVGRIVVGSFSGEYTAVRDILKLKSHYDQISDVLLADSLYPPKAGNLDDALKPFLRFARRAAEGKCGLIFTQLYPPEEKYRTNGTTVTANWLIDRIGATKESQHQQIGPRLLLYRADLKSFHVLGFAGMTNQDHFEHLYNAHELFRETSLSAP